MARIDDIFQQAMQLSSEERQELVIRLNRSLLSPEQLKEADEVQEVLQRYERGEIEAVPYRFGPLEGPHSEDPKRT